MGASKACLPPSTFLPAVRKLRHVSVEELLATLENLKTIYCPLRLPVTLAKRRQQHFVQADSGYASEDEMVDGFQHDLEEDFRLLRANDFERSFTIRWLTSLIGRVRELPYDDDEQTLLLDRVAFILSAFTDSEDNGGSDDLVRSFSFPTSNNRGNIDVHLKEALLSDTDHTDVGLQSWGASIVLSSMMCASPERFELNSLLPRAKLIELGAGTGLVSLTLAKLFPEISQSLPRITATDFHPGVLSNLRDNIAMSFPGTCASPMLPDTMLLDWAAPPEALKASATMLFAADAVYAHEHAVLLRDCATHLLANDGLFWLIVTIREMGKFEGTSASVEIAFESEHRPRRSDGAVLGILEKEMLEKKAGVGRGNESGYSLYKIGWVRD